MAKKSKSRRPKSLAIAKLSVFGTPALLEGEDQKEYSAVLAKITEAVKPTDFIEEMWVEDCTYLLWDALRLRRQKAELINANMHRGLQVVLETVCPESTAQELTADWSVRNKDAIRQINALLKSGNLSMEAVKAQTIVEIIDKIERFERMIMISEGRRNATLREMERRRSSFARAMREAGGRIQDAEFVELEAPGSEAEPSDFEANEVTVEQVEDGEAAEPEEEEVAYSEAAE
jgi:hypothetical protein